MRLHEKTMLIGLLHLSGIWQGLDTQKACVMMILDNVLIHWPFILNSQDIGGGVGKGTIQSLKELQNPDFNLL